MGGNVRYAIHVQDTPGGALREVMSRTAKCTARREAHALLGRPDGPVLAALVTVGGGVVVETIPAPGRGAIVAPADNGRPWYAAPTVPRTLDRDNRTDGHDSTRPSLVTRAWRRLAGGRYDAPAVGRGAR